MNELVDTVYEIRNGTLRHYPGSYEAYVNDVAERQAEELAPTVDDVARVAKAERKSLIREKQRALDILQTAITKMDKEKSELLAFFFENPTDYSPDKAQRLSEVTEELSRLEHKWIEGQQEVDELRK